MGIGPLVAWRRASLRSLGASFAWPAGLALLTGVVLLALGAGSSIPGLVAYTFSAFVLGSIALEFIRGTRARRALSGGSWPGAFSALVARNRRRYGGYVVHAAIVLLAIGIAGSSAYDKVGEGKLARGRVARRRRLPADLPRRSTSARPRMRPRSGPCSTSSATARRSARSRRARTRIHGGAAGLQRGRHPQRPRHRRGPVRDRGAGEPDGSVYFRVFVKPLVNMIWLAGLVFVLGALITLWPDAREQRRLAVRYGDARARAGS